MQKNKKNLVSRLIASFAKDEDTTAEEVAAVVEAILSEDPAALTEAEPAAPVVTVVPAEPPAEPAAVVVEVPTETESEAPVTGDEDPSAAILERLDRILELLTNLTAPVPAADEEKTALPEEVGEVLEAVATDPIGEAIEQVIGEIVEEAEEEPVSLIDECSEEEEQADCGKSSTTSDTLRSVLQVMKPVIAAMPKAQRKQVIDRLSKQMRSANGQKSAGGTRTYAALKNTRRASADAEDPRALGKRIMAARNVNNRK